MQIDVSVQLGAKPGEELGKDEPIFEVESLEDQ